MRLRASYFYFVVNGALWGVPTESWPVDRDRIQEISTIKIDLPGEAGQNLVAGFMFFNTAPEMRGESTVLYGCWEEQPTIVADTGAFHGTRWRGYPIR